MGNKAAGPAETPCVVADAIGMNVKPIRIVELKVKVAGGTKALASTLTEKARRNLPGRNGAAGEQTKAAKHSTTYDALMVELEKGREPDIERHVAYHESRPKL